MTDRYAVVGNPIGHSKSPLIHSAFARQTGQDIEYVAVAVPLGGFAAAADAARASGMRGWNVTVPFKLDAYAYAGTLQDAARRAGAVNALSFEGAGATGANFDGTGLVADLVRNLGFGIRGRHVLLLGAGGAARGALMPLLAQCPSMLVLANRTVAKASLLAEEFASAGPLIATGYDGLDGVHAGPYDIVVNATSASLLGEVPDLSGRIFGPDCLAYDMVYGQGLTPFLRLARDAGVKHLADGVGMLVEQAAEAFEWWRGVRPDTRPVIRALTVPLV